MNIGTPSFTGSKPRDDRGAERIDAVFPSAQEPSSAFRPKVTGEAFVAGKGDSQDDPPKVASTTQPIDAQNQSPPVLVVETPEEGTDDELLNHPPKGDDNIETDFYTNPTLLSRLVLSQKFAGAIKRVFNNPDEASVWVCAKRLQSRASESEGYSIRQLPIHIACSNLGRTHDFQMLRLLNELIALLIFACPKGAHETDHRERLPIQEAVCNGASPDTIALFLMAMPEAIHVKDNLGRSLLELNRYHKGVGKEEKESIHQMLSRGVDFWVKARTEAALRLQHNTISFPSENISLSSMSVLASTSAEEESLMTTIAQQLGGDPNEIFPISWSQLENRYIAAEQMLVETNLRNYELSKQIEALTITDQALGTELVNELAWLSRKNAALAEKLRGVEAILVSMLPIGDAEQDEKCRKALAEISSLAGFSENALHAGGEQPVLEGTSDAQAQHQELTQTQVKQQQAIRTMRNVVDELGSRDGDNDDNDDENEMSSEERSTISALTSYSAKSDLSSAFRMSRAGPADRSPHTGQQQQLFDDLSVILRYAAARERRGRAAPKKVDTDDLSAILRWAASRDDDIPGAKRSRELSELSTWSPLNPMGLLKISTASKKKSPHQRDLVLPALLSDARPKAEHVERVGAERSGLATFSFSYKKSTLSI